MRANCFLSHTRLPLVFLGPPGDSPLEQRLWEVGEAEDRQWVAAAGNRLLAWEPSCGLAQGLLGVPSGVAEA